MRNRRFRFEAPKVELTREEILADLTYPVGAPAAEDRPGPRRRHRRLRRRGS
jgi:hypothetical protein